MNGKDITGMQFGNWTVLQKDEPHPGKRNAYYICRCVCGTTKAINRSTLVSGRSKSCGCIEYDKKGINSTHGMSKTRLYHEWDSMRRRCKSATARCAENYALKGVNVCPEWETDFTAFRDWAFANEYREDLTIDRIDNSKGYSPENCRWISNEEQQRNKTNNIYIEYNGEQRCLRELCIAIGFPYKTAHRRYSRSIKRGIVLTSDELFAPIDKSKIAKKYRK